MCTDSLADPTLTRRTGAHETKRTERKILRGLRKRRQKEEDTEHEFALVSAALPTAAAALNTPQVSHAFKSLQNKTSHTASQKLECVLWGRSRRVRIPCSLFHEAASKLLRGRLSASPHVPPTSLTPPGTSASQPHTLQYSRHDQAARPRWSCRLCLLMLYMPFSDH